MKDIYLDFDRTIYDTDQLYKDMNKVILKYDIKQSKFKQIKKRIFKKPILFDYFKVVNYICDHNNVSTLVLKELENLLYNGNKYIFDDVKEFLETAKNNGYKINLLTYGDRSFQLKKLSNLDICDIIDNIIIAGEYKFDLSIDYENSIFIDDNPRDLKGLYKRNAGRLIRISRHKTKYAKTPLNNGIAEKYNSLSQIRINVLNKGDDKNE